jgi:hypothetical protein
VDQAAGAVQGLDEVEDAVRLLDLQLAPHVAEVGGAGEGGDVVAFGGQGFADGGGLVEHIALIRRCPAGTCWWTMVIFIE